MCQKANDLTLKELRASTNIGYFYSKQYDKYYHHCLFACIIKSNEGKTGSNFELSKMRI
ncbi:hypothetical protein ACU8KH_01800 [Lachancea thermotolerans]